MMTPAEIDLLAKAIEVRVADAVVARLEPRFDTIDQRIDGLDAKVDGLVDVVNAMAKGHAQRFDAIEMGMSKPPTEDWRGELA